MARSKTHEDRQKAFRLRLNLAGWVQWRSREHGGMSAYLNDLIEADRARAAEDEPETAGKYAMYLKACGYEDELAQWMGSLGEE